MKILTNDGAVFQGKTARGVVKAMQRDAWNAPEKKRDYMVEVVDRVVQQFDVPDSQIVTPMSAAELLTWLAGLGVVRIVENGEKPSDIS